MIIKNTIKGRPIIIVLLNVFLSLKECLSLFLIIEQKQREIQALKRNTHNSLTVFGAWVPQIAQKIEEAFRQRKFGKMPRGPVGMIKHSKTKIHV
jgi:hypothetical protein